MLRVATFFVAILGTVAFTSDVTNEGPNRPVTKVINLLKDMISQLEQQAKEDQDLFDTMDCWCKTNRKEKKKAIADGKTSIANLESSIQSLIALSDRLGTELKDLKKEVAESQAALDKATALRQKQLAEFNAEEKDMLESISALKSAIEVLSKHQASAFLQVQTRHYVGVQAKVGDTMTRHSELISSVLTKSQRDLINTFVQSDGPAFSSKYENQSGQIIGILKSILDTFQANLDNAQKEEVANVQSYEGLKAAKDAEVKAAQDLVDEKTEARAKSEVDKANDQQELEDTEEALEANTKYLAMLEKRCASADAEFSERKKTRQEETLACQEALKFLTSDEAHDLFTRTFNPSFMQVSSMVHKSSKEQASELLRRVARKNHNPRLSTLAVNVKLDAFTKVKTAIDAMIKDLLKEKADEIKHKDFCNKGFNEIQLKTEDLQRSKDAHEVAITDLEADIAKYTDDIERLTKEVSEERIQMKRDGENRAKANKEYQTAVMDQKNTQRLLQFALNALQKFYDKKKTGSFVQDEPVGPPPPAGFKEYKNNAQSGGVMQMIQQILADAKKLEAELTQDEQDSQTSYEDGVKQGNELIKKNNQDISDLTEVNATSTDDLLNRNKDLEETNTELENQDEEKQRYHGSCDFTLKNFDMRQQARDEEVEALRQALAILSGAK